MRVVEAFPYVVREIEHTWIPLPDGCRLSARVWLPEGAGPVPAIVEYIPYRKRDDTRWRDEPMHGYFAGHGYAAVRVDVRGAGASDGVLGDEYSNEEWADGLAALRWLASQPWCDGNVGLMGKSWGGINALQLASLRPPELKCVITVCSTDDRWSTDAHWMGGCLLAENLTWGSVLQTLSMRPQDPELVGAAWRETWLRRIHEAPFYAARWLRHPTRDAYWKRGSVCDAYDRIEVPVLAVGGWADAYADTVPRLLAGLSGPRRGWVGPWAHVYPHNGEPGPAAGFLQVALRWWDRWLRGMPDAVEEPTYRIWMHEGGAHRPDGADAAGRWVAEKGWPSPRVQVEEHRLASAGAARVVVPWTGLGARAGGAWCPFGVADLAAEQSPDDGESCVLDLAPLSRRVELLGAPEVTLRLRCDEPFGMVAVRLCDVHPDGTSVRVSYGLLDLAFREGFEARRSPEPGRDYDVRVPLRHAAYAFPPGHRLRVAVSTSYWPVAWPASKRFRLTLDPARCSLRLPVRAARPEDARLPALPPPEVAPATDMPEEPGATREIRREPGSAVYTSCVRQGWGADGEPHMSAVEPIGLETGWGIEDRFQIDSADPASAEASVRHVAVSRRGSWIARLEVSLEQRRTADGYRLSCDVVATEGGQEVARRRMEEEIPLGP